MKIIAHRGLWLKESEKNSFLSLKRSLINGFGVETDVRDYKGELVIAHDIPQGNEIKLENFLNLLKDNLKNNDNLIIALNIKADGLSYKLMNLLKNFDQNDYFFFDMSTPDMKNYSDNKQIFFTRMSNEEPISPFFNKAYGVWLDSFSKKIWYNLKLINKIINEKKVCIVSPELHGYDYLELWDMIFPIKDNPNLYLCTDLPIKAKKFFQLS